jgi:uncharacterized protein YjbJ (UPF0337 family)
VTGLCPLDVAEMEGIFQLCALADRMWRFIYAPLASEDFQEIRYKECIMNRDQAKGRIEQAAGKARETIGKVKGNKNLERKGKLQKDLGRARAVYGNSQEDIKNPKTSR